MSFLKKLFTEDQIKPLLPIVEKINSLEADFAGKSREALVAATNEWKMQVQEGLAKLSEVERANRKVWRKETDRLLEAILPQAFACVREAAKRTLFQRHFDVQLLGGLILHRGSIAEMRTGEGKTLAATLPVYLNALAGHGAHVITVNDYLARRDASWMGQVYNYLGLSVGVIQHDGAFRYEKTPREVKIAGSEPAATFVELDVKDLVPCARREAYSCDITYGTNNEYGFDYLRDNMVPDLSQKVQRRLHFAIVDEVDSILIDEARTPLIISAPDTAPTDQYYEFAKLVGQLAAGSDFAVDEKKKSATLTEVGVARLEKLLGLENIYVERGVTTVHHIEQALRASTLFKKDRDYVVRDGQVVIVDEFTGRLLPGRRYSEGLHQAIEAKEGVAVERESKTMAIITFQNYFRLYHKLAGMTGTAMTEEEEFRKIYGLSPVEVPTHRPMVRQDAQDWVFKTQKGKYDALVREVKARFSRGQPVLIGTVSIEKNELVSGVLKTSGVPHQVLNAKNHEQEAKIIAQAGRFRAVTLATNIAGRGVDIILGGNPYSPEAADQVRKVGGLHVIGTERHESRRIDNQLRGRSGRQGDPGSAQFFVSLEDDLIRIFGGDRVQKMMNTLGVPDDMPIEHGLVSRVIEQAQKKIEGLNFDVRKHVLEYDDVMNRQREVIYRIRDRVLQPDADLKAEIVEKISVEINQQALAAEDADSGAEAFLKTVANIFPLNASALGGKIDSDRAVAQARLAYGEKEKKLTAPLMRAVERAITLQSIDSLWMEHLDTMEHLRQGVRLRGYAQRDPLIEYKREGFDLFQRLLAEIDKQIVYTIFKVELRAQNTPLNARGEPVESVSGGEGAMHSAGMVANNSSPGRALGVAKKIGRNDPCHCGSGMKFKKCHGR